ncbi:MULTISPECIES: GNAT family N-acetyltransferase [unclassified Nocardiopsis]|uniref:GNAT family N-acetyltransferase n=1 Tax=unclassified Nocardiopsis TaxID=2649073 RepID=UPI0013594EBC|nr:MULTISPECIES: GNAT family N-acetyltransferase [unclassified Nocardiopsis]
MHIDEVAWDDPDARALRAAQRAEIAERYGTPDSEPGTAPSAADVAVFVVARDAEGAAVGCGGLRELGDAAGEVKRMYVRPERRGSGAAALVLAALEDRARERGWKCLRLETGDRQPDAVRFYTRSGYAPIPPFGAYADCPSSLCFEKVL